MNYEIICTAKGYDISYGEGQVLPWRVSKNGGNGEYFKTPEDVGAFLKGEKTVYCFPNHNEVKTK